MCIKVNIRKWFKEITLNLFLLLMVAAVVNMWQGRGVIESIDPSLSELTVLKLEQDRQLTPISFLDSIENKRIVYFFAPWCGVCSLNVANMGNLKDWGLVRPEEILYVGLGYERAEEVFVFLEEHHISGAVVLGTDALQEKLNIQGFPTTLFVDADGSQKRVAIGYLSVFGAMWRYFLT